MPNLIGGSEIEIRPLLGVLVQNILNGIGLTNTAIIIRAQNGFGVALHGVEVFGEKLFAALQRLLVELQVP